jgi:DNA-binding CsgD family transcriptional regulator
MNVGFFTLFIRNQTDAKLAVMVADGPSLEDVAEQRQTSLATARSQLKAVFAKTGTHRQSELVALLEASASAERIERRIAQLSGASLLAVPVLNPPPARPTPPVSRAARS